MSNTPPAREPQFGEPWRHDYMPSDGNLIVCEKGDVTYSDSWSNEGYMDRAIACVNLLAGHEPANVVILDRETVEEVKRFLSMMHCNGRGIECFPPNPYDGREASPEWELLNSLLTKLTASMGGEKV